MFGRWDPLGCFFRNEVLVRPVRVASVLGVAIIGVYE